MGSSQSILSVRLIWVNQVLYNMPACFGFAYDSLFADRLTHSLCLRFDPGNLNLNAPVLLFSYTKIVSASSQFTVCRQANM